MNTINLKAYAKINLGLDVVGRRQDGYHEVRMIMQTVGIWDDLELEREGAPGGVTVTAEEGELRAPDLPAQAVSAGGPPAGSLPAGRDNLVWKAAEAVRKRYGITEGVRCFLRKRIPVAAGMAGGSSDAAAALRGMNLLFGLGASPEELGELAVGIGADVPYCIGGGTALCEGIGEILTPLPDAPSCALLVAKPEISVSTREVYGRLRADALVYHPDIDGMAEAIRQGSVEGVAVRLGNVLETVTERDYPVIRDIKGTMLAAGAMGALMSGSGPTVFGLFRREEDALAGLAAVRKSGLAGPAFVTGFVRP